VVKEIWGENGFQLLGSDVMALKAKVDQLPIVAISEANVLLQVRR
jgi:hypothetical protein